MKICKKCGHKNGDNDKFCGQCGNKLPKIANYCPNCSLIYTNNNKFCTQCGTELVVKSDYFKKKSQNIKKVNKKQNYSLKTSTGDLTKDYKVKSKFNPRDTVVIVEEENSSDYSKLSNITLEHMLDNARDLHKSCLKSQDPMAYIYLQKVHRIKGELSKRTKQDEPDPIKLKQNKKPNKNTTKIKYKKVQELFLMHPIETDILLNEVCNHLKIDYNSYDEAFTILCKNHTEYKIKETIKHLEKTTFKRHPKINKNKILPKEPKKKKPSDNQSSNTIEQKKRKAAFRPRHKRRKKSFTTQQKKEKSPNKSSKKKKDWKVCKKCYSRVYNNSKCPHCNSTEFLDPKV